MTPMHFLMLGYGLIWVGLGIYFFRMNRRISQVHRDIEELRERVGRAGSA